jgi:hypothetical protein
MLDDDLYRDVAPQADLPRTTDFTHAASSDDSSKVVPGDISGGFLWSIGNPRKAEPGARSFSVLRTHATTWAATRREQPRQDRATGFADRKAG